MLVYAAVGQGGVQAQQATGVFASEAGQSGWSQLIDSVNLHPPPLAHEPSATPRPRPTSQSRPPAVLQSNHAADHHHQQTPVMAAHTQQALPPAAAPEELAQLEAAQHGLEFQYDSFSDSMGDELMPEAASQAPHTPHRNHLRSAADEAAQAPQQGTVDSPGHTPPGEQSQEEQQQQHEQQEVGEQRQGSMDTLGQAAPPQGQHPGEQQQQHKQQEVDEPHEQHNSQPAVLPQTDGAGDSDSVHSQDPPDQVAEAKLLPAQQEIGDGRQLHLSNALAEQQPVQLTLQAEDQGPGQRTAQQQGQPVTVGFATGTAAVQRPRKRRSRHVVQHAVRLAAAARDAMDSVAAPQDASNARLLQGNAPGHQSELQLPSWLQPQAAADRAQYQSEPQLPRSWIAHADVPSDPGVSKPGSSAWQGQGQVQVQGQGQVQGQRQELGQGQGPGQGQGQRQGQGRHHLREDSQYGGIGRPGNVTHQHASQSTVAAAAAAGSALDSSSQIVSDSRATSDMRWQRRPQHRMLSMLQQSQRLESQVVSDSRATSDLRWAQPRQTWEASLELQPVPSQDSAERDILAPTQGHELAWEQPASAEAIAVIKVLKPACGAASGAPPGVAGAADDLEVVISDSQPSPVQQPGRSVDPTKPYPPKKPPYPHLPLLLHTLLLLPPHTKGSCWLKKRLTYDELLSNLA